LYYSINLDICPMKLLFTLIASFIGFGVFGQYAFHETFEYPFDAYRANFTIDTVNCSNNIWQIGKPQKTVFHGAYSSPNVIITDTLNPYPINDTSIFYLRTVGMYHGLLSLIFYYRLDIDTLSSAKIEVSGDVGLNWINPMTEDTTYMFYWVGGKPRLDTSTSGWRLFNLNMDTWSYAYPGHHVDTFPHYRTSDTILYRFTFISGNSSMHGDGWMMDNFLGENTVTVGVGDADKISSCVFPNPTKGTIYLHPDFTTSDEDRIVVYNMEGQQVYTTSPPASLPVSLPLPDGVYTLKYFGSSGVATNRVVIIK